MAVSGGILAVPMCEHFCSLDRPICWPRWVLDSDLFDKHVALNSFHPAWLKASDRVRGWKYMDVQEPDFSTNPDAVIAAGPLPINYSLLFAVQLAPKLGYKRCVFMGCDMLLNELSPIGDVLEAWWPRAKSMGIEWFNASPISILRAWMPSYEGAALEIHS